jgi:hypothetical protein
MIKPSPTNPLRSQNISEKQKPTRTHPYNTTTIMAEQQPDNTEEETYLPSASGVQDFYPPLDKNFPLPAEAKAEDDGEKKPASPAKEEKKPAVAAVAAVAAEKAAKPVSLSKDEKPVAAEKAAKAA